MARGSKRRFAGLLLPLLASATGHATPQFLQGTCSHVTVPGATASLGFPGDTSGASLLVVLLEYQGTTTTAVADSMGNTYVRAGSSISTPINTAEVWYAVSADAGPNTVTTTLGAISADVVLYLHEYGGFAGNPTLEGMTYATDPASTTLDAGTLQVSAPPALLFAAASSGVITAGPSGFHVRQTCSGDMSADLVVTSAGSYDAVFTAAVPGGGYAALLAFNSTDAGGAADGGTHSDAGGILLDAGSAVDAGENRGPYVAGCGCSAGSTQTCLGFVLLLVGQQLRRSHRRA